MSKAAAKIDEPTAEPATVEPLDSRIAAVLGSNEEFSAEFLATLYGELDDAVGVADATARECRARSIDPLCRDGIAERSRAEDLEFISHRLKAAATPLHEKHKQALIRELTVDWNRKANVVERLVDEFATELADLDKAAFDLYCKYNDACRAIEAVDHKIAWFDKRVGEINGAAPIGEARRLVGPTLKEELAMTAMVLAKKAEREAPKAEVLDFSIATRTWKPDPSVPVLTTYEQRLAAHEQSKAKETAAMQKIYDDRNAAAAQIEKEAQRRALAASAERRQWENGL